MLQLENQTPFSAMMYVLADRSAIDTVYVVVKATLMLRPRLSLAPEQLPISLTDRYYADPATSSLKESAELHVGKPGTDVLLVGQAWGPRGHAVQDAQVSLSVAGRCRTIRVFGDRVWQRDGTPSLPEPFEAMPLVWERAFGGVSRTVEGVLAEERNPVGIGFAGERGADELEGHPVPNLEDPDHLLERQGQRPAPVCFAPAAPHWMPRRRFAGTYGAQWQRTRAPYLPADFDPRFLQCAVCGMAFDSHLQGNEPVEVGGVTPDGPVSFVVPAANLEIAVTIAGDREHPPANLETLLIEPDENRLCLTWRAELSCDRKALKVEKVTVARKRSGTRS
jgi:hypothetical protein